MMDQVPLIDEQNVPAQKTAQVFSDMASRVMLNKDGHFGGAVVIVPPENGGEPVEMFMLTRESPAAFWAVLKALVDRNIADLDSLARQGRAYGR